MTLGEAYDRFFAEHGLDPEAYAARRFRVPLGPITLVFPNPGQLPLHDLHHVALGAPPAFWGEVEVSALELRAGPPNMMIAILCAGALALGALRGPRRTWSWWRRYRNCSSLYGRDREALLGFELEAVRTSMGLGAVTPPACSPSSQRLGRSATEANPEGRRR